jgi:pyruvate/2-oxoglutarate dehydrogenase complex dihydrolipoamide acyltransferase (E2) component
MALVDVVLPKWGLMEDGTILSWLRQPGDQVAEGDSVAEVETDKAQAEIPSPTSGRLAEILVEAGARVSVGVVVARIETVE